MHHYCAITNIDQNAFLNSKPRFISINSQTVSEKSCHFANVCALIPSCAYKSHTKFRFFRDLFFTKDNRKSEGLSKIGETMAGR